MMAVNIVSVWLYVGCGQSLQIAMIYSEDMPRFSQLYDLVAGLVCKNIVKNLSVMTQRRRKFALQTHFSALLPGHLQTLEEQTGKREAWGRKKLIFNIHETCIFDVFAAIKWLLVQYSSI